MQVKRLMMPSLSLWAISSGRQFENLMNHLTEKAEHHLLRSLKQRYSFKKGETDTSMNVDHEQNAKTYLELINLNLQFIYAYILINFREQKQSDDENDAEDTTSSSASERENKMARLNEYYHLLQEKLNVKLELYKIDSVLDDYLSLSKKYLNLIETDSWPSMDLSNAFEWLSDRFLRKLIQMSAQIDAKDYLCPEFVLIFRNFTLLFAIDCEFIKSKVSCIFVLYSSGALIFLVKQIKY